MPRSRELSRRLSEQMPTRRMGCASSSLFLSLIPLIKKNTFLLLSSQTMTQLQCCAKATGTINVLSYQHRLMLEFSLQAEDSKGEEVRVGQGAESYCLPETDWCATTRSLLLFPTHCCCYCLQTAAARIGNHI